MTMAEKIARALIAQDCDCSSDCPDCWGGFGVEYTASALAALRALRDPTDTMIIAGLGQQTPDITFTAMIDAAIAEAQPSNRRA